MNLNLICKKAKQNVPEYFFICEMYVLIKDMKDNVEQTVWLIKAERWNLVLAMFIYFLLVSVYLVSFFCLDIYHFNLILWLFIVF